MNLQKIRTRLLASMLLGIVVFAAALMLALSRGVLVRLDVTGEPQNLLIAEQASRGAVDRFVMKLIAHPSKLQQGLTLRARLAGIPQRHAPGR